MIKFFVRGDPISQPRPRVTVRGRFPHAYTPESHAVWGWRAAIARSAAQHKPLRTLSGPLKVDLIFSMPRPLAHYGTGSRATVLKADAPVYHTIAPDVDNLSKPIFDVLTECGFWGDDSQIAIGSVIKKYAAVKPGCWVLVQCVEAPGLVRMAI